MKYVPQWGDTFYTVALKFTGNGELAEPLALHNLIYDDVIPSTGEMLPYARGSSIAWASEIDIPDAWIKKDALDELQRKKISFGAAVTVLSAVLFLASLLR